MKTTKRARHEATQLFHFCHIRGLVNEALARNLVQQILAAKPNRYLATLSHFRRLVKLDRAQHTAKVESAKPVTADLHAHVQTDLTLLYGPEYVSRWAAVLSSAERGTPRSAARRMGANSFQSHVAP